MLRKSITLALMVAMLVAGIALLSLFLIWDLRFASRPVIAPRFVRNRSVIIAGFIGLLDFVRLFLHIVPTRCSKCNPSSFLIS